jgi:hypothetical protein
MRLITKNSRNLQTECGDTPVGQLDEEELPTSSFRPEQVTSHHDVAGWAEQKPVGRSADHKQRKGDIYTRIQLVPNVV